MPAEIEDCQRAASFYIGTMSLNQKLRSLAILPAAGLLLAGCGGLNTTQSVSPATFLMPGFMQNVPARPSSEPADESFHALAGLNTRPQTQIP